MFTKSWNVMLFTYPLPPPDWDMVLFEPPKTLLRASFCAFDMEILRT